MFIRFFSLLMFCLTVSATGAWAEPKSSTDKIVDRFIELDQDSSEGVSLDEYLLMVNERAKVRFEEMDANRDGEVTDPEYRDFWQKKKAQWYRLER
ncbi:thymidylate synthase [Mariprofundus sp. NF]|uniref:thymidylate synthase n=1 Tax=Mariprofundus sp. NF TaxID=2608716 RepID=UPI0015A1AD99|nr:thymidylate synthase [Mariprofundus sp. NF]NWF37573.1 thymidylate synthase [Mariprofundus sp. NF]